MDTLNMTTIITQNAHFTVLLVLNVILIAYQSFALV